MSDKLTIDEAGRIGDLLSMCQRNAKIKWSNDGGDHVQDGVARAICNEHGGFIARDADVRDGFVWISGIVETFMPVRDALDLMRQYLFVEASS